MSTPNVYTMPSVDYKLRNSLFNLSSYNNSAPSRLQSFEDFYRSTRNKSKTWDKTPIPTKTSCKTVSMNDLQKCQSFLSPTWLDCDFIQKGNAACKPLAKKMQDLAGSPNLNFDGTTNVRDILQNEIIKSLSAVNGKQRLVEMKTTPRHTVAYENEQNTNDDVIKSSEEKAAMISRIHPNKTETDYNGNEQSYTPVRHMANLPILSKSEACSENRNMASKVPSATNLATKSEDENEALVKHLDELVITEEDTQKVSHCTTWKSGISDKK